LDKIYGKIKTGGKPGKKRMKLQQHTDRNRRWEKKYRQKESCSASLVMGEGGGGVGPKTKKKNSTFLKERVKTDRRKGAQGSLNVQVSIY